MARKPISIVYIAGSGRSGSTVLDVLLGQLTGFISVGEIRLIWEKGYEQNRLCGCMEKFHDCGFWSDVTKQAFGAESAPDAERLRALSYKLVRRRRLAQLVGLGGLGSNDAELAEYRDVLSRLYHAVADVSGCRVLVDASKEPAYGYILSQLPDVELYTVHLIRDSRAVAYSWSKKKVMTFVHWKKAYMGRYPPSVASRGWILANLLAARLRARSRRYMRVYYEDFAERPQEVVSSISSMLGGPGVEAGAFHELCEGPFRNHGVSGNPVRLEQSGLRIRPDHEWKSKLSARDRRLVTTLTFPLLLRYGYLGSARALAR